MTLIKFKDRIILYRTSHNLSQEQMGAKLGLSKQSISNWERGVHLPKLSDINAIAQGLDVTQEWLLGVNIEENNPARDCITRTKKSVNTSSSTNEYDRVRTKLSEKAFELYSAGRISKEAFIELIMADE